MCGPAEDAQFAAMERCIEDLKKIHRTDEQLHRAAFVIKALAAAVDDYDVDNQLSRLGFGPLRARSKSNRKAS